MHNWKDLAQPRGSSVAVTHAGDGLAYQRIWEWVAYPDVQPNVETRTEEGEITKEPAIWWTPKFRGFRASILSNPLGGQVRRESEAYRAYTERRITEPEYLETIADRVRAWEYVIIDDEGARHEIPAPGQDTWERFYDLPAGLLAWLVSEVRTIHFPKARTSGSPAVGITDSTIPTATAPEPEPQTS